MFAAGHKKSYRWMQKHLVWSAFRWHIQILRQHSLCLPVTTKQLVVFCALFWLKLVETYLLAVPYEHFPLDQSSAPATASFCAFCAFLRLAKLVAAKGCAVSFMVNRNPIRWDSEQPPWSKAVVGYWCLCVLCDLSEGTE